MANTILDGERLNFTRDFLGGVQPNALNVCKQPRRGQASIKCPDPHFFPKSAMEAVAVFEAKNRLSELPTTFMQRQSLTHALQA
jgi:hypothetical protein